MLNSEYVDDLTLSEVKSILSKKKVSEMSYEQKMAYEHAKMFSKLSLKKAEKLKKELVDKLDLTKELATKITDILPNETELNLIAEKSKEIGEDNKDEILELIKKYKK